MLIAGKPPSSHKHRDIYEGSDLAKPPSSKAVVSCVNSKSTHIFGGQHRAPSGDTTRPTDAQLEWFNREVQREIDRVDWTAPF